MDTAPPLQLLLIEDTVADAETIRRVMAEAKNLPADVEWVSQLTQGLDVLGQRPIDLVLTDLSLPDARGIDSVKRLHASHPAVPIIVLTASDDEATISRALETGAQDFIVKGYIEVYRDLLPRAVRYAVERKRAQEKEKALLARAAASEFQRTAELNAAYERLKRTQALLIQSEKLAAVGQLASGIAHEVKNPLNIILQCVNYLEPEMADREKAREMLEIIREAVKSADKIIRGLLDFSRPMPLELKPTPIALVVNSALLLVEARFAPCMVRLTKDVPEGLPPVMVDAGQIQQVLINLFLNSLDAMPNGGELRVRVVLEPQRESGDGVGVRSTDMFRPGQLAVVVEVSDTGMGIAAQHLTNVFDPFFTTKAPGEGVGLGLAITAAIIENHRGLIQLQSEENKGTTVRILLPLAGDGAGPAGSGGQASKGRGDG